MTQPVFSAFIWSVADLLRGDFKQSEYGKVILPFTVLRRLDCVLDSTKADALADYADRKKVGLNPGPFVERFTGKNVRNISPLDLKKLAGHRDNIRENLYGYRRGFSLAVRDIFERFEFHTQIDRPAKAKLLYQVAELFAQIDLGPTRGGQPPDGAGLRRADSQVR